MTYNGYYRHSLKLKRGVWMNILVAGGSGFVGTGLGKYLAIKYKLTLLSRTKRLDKGSYTNVITWDELSATNISDYDIVINLCGYSIGQRRWSKFIKKKIISSRIEPTQRLVDLIGNKDIWLINASAIGFYNFSKEAQDEDNYLSDISNQGFSQNIVSQWEKVLTISALQRYTILRFGVVIGDGGILEKMTMTVKLGILIKFASGKQLMSWISEHDLVRAFEYVIENNYSQKEIFNLTAPNVTSNEAMIASIKQVTNAKLVLGMPRIMIKLMFGQMGNELLLSNQDIKPKNLVEKGFKFNDESIESALEKYL